MKAINNYFCWVIAYIDSAHIDKVEAQLQKNGEYSQVEAYIPTVKILKKSIKNEQLFEEVPLLFNYGFFKIPRKFAIHREYLETLKNNVSCIYAWVKDPVRMNSSIGAATASSQEITDLIKQSLAYSAYSADDIDGLKEGDIITLRGYPWEGIRARVMLINPDKEIVKVEIQLMDRLQQVKLSFDNVFFTIYHSKQNYDDSLSLVASLDEMVQNNQLDRFLHKKFKDDGGDK